MENKNIFQRIKNIFSHALVRAFFISLVTVIVTIAIIAGLLWHYRARVFKLLATGYVQQLAPDKASSVAVAPNDPTPSLQALSQQIAASNPTVAAPQTAPADTVVDSVKKAKPAVVSIVIYKDVPAYNVTYQDSDPFNGLFPGMTFQTPVYTPNGTKRQEIGGGSGFLISSDGLIVTNKHVVSDPDAIYEIQLNNGKKYTGQVLARDSVLDVAFVKIAATGLPYLTLGDSDQLEIGQSVVAIGNALGQFNNTVSVGVVSGLSRSITAGDDAGQSEQLDKVIQTDAAINPGNSGGPLLDLSGNVVGVDVAVVEGSSNIGFALPINSLKTAIASVRATGKIIRPYVGIRYIPIDADVKAKNNLTVDHGVLVQRGATASDVAVIPGSPANKAGIVEGDIILSIDGQNIDADHDFSSLIRDKNIGDTVRLVVLSKGIQKTFSLKLEQAPTNG